MNIHNIDDSELIKAMEVSGSLRETCKYLKISGTQYQYKKLRKIIEKYNLDVSHHRTVSDSSFQKWKNELSYVDQEFINECDCFKDIPVKLGLHKKDIDLATKYYTILKDFINSSNLDISHFTFSKGGHPGKRYSEEEIFCENSDVNKKTLKSRYLKHRDSLDIPYKCDIIDCKLSTWHGKELNLQLDHVNGINNDNRIKNLRLLCSNCHSQTVTFAGRKP